MLEASGEEVETNGILTVLAMQRLGREVADLTAWLSWLLAYSPHWALESPWAPHATLASTPLRAFKQDALWARRIVLLAGLVAADSLSGLIAAHLAIILFSRTHRRAQELALWMQRFVREEAQLQAWLEVAHPGPATRLLITAQQVLARSMLFGLGVLHLFAPSFAHGFTSRLRHAYSHSLGQMRELMESEGLPLLKRAHPPAFALAEYNLPASAGMPELVAAMQRDAAAAAIRKRLHDGMPDAEALTHEQ